MGEIAQTIKQIANEDQVIQTWTARVKNVNFEEDRFVPDREDAYTINVIREDGAEIKNVRLKSSIQDKNKGVITIPEENSWVHISTIGKTETKTFVSQFSKVKKLIGRIESTSVPGQYLDYAIDGDAVSLNYIKDDSTDGSEEAEIKNLASSNFTPDGLTTVFNDIVDSEEKERLSVKMSNLEDTVEIKFTEGDNKDRNITTIKPDESTFSLKDGNGDEKQKTTLTKDKVETSFIDDDQLKSTLTKDSAKVTVKDSETIIEADKVELKNKNSFCKLDTSGIELNTDKDVNIMAADVNITASGSVNIGGPTVNIN